MRSLQTNLDNSYKSVVCHTYMYNNMCSMYITCARHVYGMVCTCVCNNTVHVTSCNACRELADLQKANAVNQSAVQHAVASAEQSKQAEVKIMLEQQKVASQKDKECLVMQASS